MVAFGMDVRSVTGALNQTVLTGTQKLQEIFSVTKPIVYNFEGWGGPSCDSGNTILRSVLQMLLRE